MKCSSQSAPHDGADHATVGYRTPTNVAVDHTTHHTTHHHRADHGSRDEQYGGYRGGNEVRYLRESSSKD